MDAVPPQDPPAHVEQGGAYVYAATDYRPRQRREIELCEKASSFDWLYTGIALGGEIASVTANTQYFKFRESPGARMFGPITIGFFWGMFLSGGYLSLPKCDPLWSYGPPPEGAVRASWPLATAITIISVATAPVMDYAFLGTVPTSWEVSERSTRVFVAMGTGLIGAIFPYVVPPKTWAAKKEIERIRVGEVAGGPYVSYGFAF